MSRSFGEALRRLRIQKGLSQQQLADRLFVDRSTVAHWELGRRMPDIAMIGLLSECLDVDAVRLMHAAEDPSEEPNVIMVDDEKIILTGGLPVLESVLPEAAVYGFSKPSEALTFARDNRVDLAFLDIEMGLVSGLDLCRELLQINARTNVVYLTAYAEFSFDAWDTGASGFLLKPLTVDAVRKQLSRLRYPVRGLGL